MDGESSGHQYSAGLVICSEDKMAEKTEEIIIVDMNNLESIKRAEKKKTRLENKGHNLISTKQIGFNKFKFIYN